MLVTKTLKPTCTDSAAQILEIQLYVLRGFDDEGKSYGDKIKYGSHQSIRKLYGRPQVDSIIQTEIDERRGSLLITSQFPLLS